MKIKGINFSPKYATGSIETRKNTMKQLCSEIYANIIEEYQPVRYSNTLSMAKTSIKLRTIEQLVKNTMPENINFYITKKRDGKLYDGCLMTKLDRYKIQYYRIELPGKNKELPIEKIPTCMHEITHLLDYALNPQFRVVTEKLAKTEKLAATGNFYKNLYYTRDDFIPKQVEKETNAFLKGNTFEEKLLILKYIKLQLMTEINGFNAGKYYNDEISKHKGFITIPNNYQNSQYHFEEKINLIENIRYKILKKEQRNNKRIAILNNLRFDFLRNLRILYCKRTVCLRILNGYIDNFKNK